MKEKIVPAIMLTLLLTSMLTLALNVQPAKAGGTIYIGADGSIDPPDAPMSTVDNVTYTFIDNIINQSIVVERDNIVVDGAGYTLQGTVEGNGIDLFGRSNVTIKNMNIEFFYYSIRLYSSLNNRISGNNITNNEYEYGIYLEYSANNSISGNTITNKHGGIEFLDSANNSISGNKITNSVEGIYLDSSHYNSISGNTIDTSYHGIMLYESRNNSISGNKITASNNYGIYLTYSSSYNCISGNTITNNGCGIGFRESSNSSICHNNFINNTRQVYDHSWDNPGFPPSTNTWDDGYPSGGNYWSDYNGTDLFNGPNQNVTESDGIGDTAYVIDENNTDNYPLMKPYDIRITSLTASKTLVGQGYNLTIIMKILNHGINTETFNLTAYANETAIQTIRDIVLTNGNSTTLTFTWDTTGFAMGNYTLSAVADTVTGETDTEDNTFIDGWVYVGIPGDINADGIVELMDFYYASPAFGSYPGHPRWNPNADVNADGIVEMMDFFILSQHFGEHYP